MFKYEDDTLRSGWSMARNFCVDFLIKYYIIYIYTIEQISIFSLRFQMFVSWMSKSFWKIYVRVAQPGPTAVPPAEVDSVTTSDIDMVIQ